MSFQVIALCADLAGSPRLPFATTLGVFWCFFFFFKEKFMGVLPDKQNTNGFFYRGLVIDLAVFERLDPDLCRNRLIFLGKTPSLGFGNPLKKDR